MKIDLYRLLPAVHRNRDAALGEPLRALLRVLGDETDAMRQDIDRLYDDWFIETCDEWVVPYIGDLFGVEGMHPGEPEVFSLRPFVANSLAYRRRKGTSSVLENIAQDVSDWSVRVVEFFQLVTTSQHPNHVRMTTVWSTDESESSRIGAVGTIDISKTPLLARLGTAFDTSSRTIDIRPFTQYDGWHNIDRLGIFIWRLRSYPMRLVPVLSVGDAVVDTTRQVQRFCLHPLGIAFPLFASPVREGGSTQRRREWEVPQPIDRDAFNADTASYYGDEKGLLFRIAGNPVEAAYVVATDLGDWDGSDWQLPSPPEPSAGDAPPDHWVFVDVERGRFVIEGTSPVAPADVRATYHYGFSANLGGGPYGRHVTALNNETEIIHVAKCSTIDTIQKALDRPRTASCTVIRIMDSEIYTEPYVYAGFEDGEEIVIEAADGERPTIEGYMYFEALDSDTSSDGFTPLSLLRLSGLLVKGYMLVEGRLRTEIAHCTLLPDPAQFGSDGALHAFSLSYFMEIDIRHSIIGPLRINPGIKQLRIRDSIVDAAIPAGGDPDVPAIRGVDPAAPGPDSMIERSTVFGDVHVRAMPLASESIFAGQVRVERKHDGCMRYCYVDASVDGREELDALSRTPRRFRCQPDLALEGEGVDEVNERARIRKRLKPAFRSRIFGQPDYGRLDSRGPEEIRVGAENGSEMGGLSHLMEPQREANVREAVRRYLPFGLQMNILYADEETQS